jgi:hypothetical protein
MVNGMEDGELENPEKREEKALVFAPNTLKNARRRSPALVSRPVLATSVLNIIPLC